MKPSRSILCLLVLLPVALTKPHHSHHQKSHHHHQESTPSSPSTSSTSAHNFLGGAAVFASGAAGGAASFAAGAFNSAGNFATGVAKTVVGSTVQGAELAIDAAHAGAKSAVDVAKVGVEEAAVIGQNVTQPIFPGTRWCGAGNKAKNDTQVGLFKDSDHCCMNHDNCFDNIPVGKEKHGLINEGTFTRSHCNCDEEFYNCLKEADSIVSKKIGYTYFNVLKPQCFREERPASRCTDQASDSTSKRCLEQVRSNEQYDQKTWRWVNATKF